MKLFQRAILAIALIAGLSPAFAQAPAPVPALPDAERRTSYSITASTCVCAVNMALYGDSSDYWNWVEVWINGVNVTYNDPTFGWTITSPSGPLANLARPISNAVLTFNSPQTGNIQIVGARRPRRVSQFSESAGVSARNLNQAITDLVAQNRETWDRTNDIAGRAPLLPPGETMGTLPPLASRANMGACFDGNGRLAPCVGAPSGSFIAGAGITFTGTSPTTIATTVVGNANAAIVSSRTIAQTLDLHTFSVVKTLGYAVGADSGGATFQNVGSTTFLDQQISGATLAGGSGYVNGTYRGVPLTGGTGNNCNGLITVSGSAVTNVSLGVPCVGYTVGDVLTTPNTFLGGSGSGFTWTVTSTTTPLASFTDSVGTHFQYVVDAGNYPNVKQFGAKGDWHNNGSDAGATNDKASFQAAVLYGGLNDGHSPGNGGFAGRLVVVPWGGYLICGGLINPLGVRLSGQSVMGTLLKQCTAEATGTHFITLCDTTFNVGQFGCRIEHMTLFSDTASSDNGIAMIYSTNGQQQPLVDDVLIETKSRGCVKYELGFGGAANAIFKNIDCEYTSASNSNDGFHLNSSGTQIILDNVVFGCGAGGCAANAISLTNGNLIAEKINFEGFATGLSHNASSGVIGSLKQVTATGCASVVSLASTNAAGNLILENINPGDCTRTVLNGQSGGSNITGSIYLQRLVSP